MKPVIYIFTMKTVRTVEPEQQRHLYNNKFTKSNSVKPIHIMQLKATTPIHTKKPILGTL